MAQSPIIDSKELLKRIPVSGRTLGKWVKEGYIPFIRPPGSRRLLFHWPDVEEALRRRAA